MPNPSTMPPRRPDGAADSARSKPILDDLRRSLALLNQDGHAIEVRAVGLGKAGAVVSRFAPGDFDGAAQEAALFSGQAQGVYVVLNGVRPDMRIGKRLQGGGAKAADVPRRAWLLVDCDPVRPADSNATDGEKSLAVQLAETIRSALRALGWPEPILADSGNGAHLLYRIDLPNDAESTAIVKAVLATLAVRFDTEAVKVDRKVFDAPRLVKLYGTRARKGPATPDRPHRYSAVLSAPADPESVPVMALKEMAAESTPPTFGLDAEVERKREAPEPDRPSENGRAISGRPDAETRAAAYLAKCDPAIAGQAGHDQTFKVACKVGPGFDLASDVALRLLRDHYNPRCEPPWADKELQHKIDESYKVEVRRGWLLDADRPAVNGKAHGKAADQAEALDLSGLSDEDLGIVRASAVRPGNVQWLWKYRLAIGELALTAGDGGIGKSMLIQWILSTITRGGAWPCGEGRAEAGNVVIVSAEDDPATSIKPRLMAMGADLDRITFLKAKLITRRAGRPPAVDFMSLGREHHPYWKETFRRLAPTAVVVDPLPSYLGRGVNDSKNTEIRAVIEPFIEEIVRPAGICLIGNTHLNKSTNAKTPLQRISGSVAYGNIPRNTHLVARDPDKPGRRIFQQAKCNDAPDDLPAIAFTVERTTVEFEGEVIETARPVFEAEGCVFNMTAAVAGGGREGAPRGPSAEKTTALAAWLFDALSDGMKHPLAALFDLAGEAGHLGRKKPDGKWSGVSSLYDARKAVPNLTDHRAGKRVDDLTAPFREGGRPIVHWYSVDADAPF